MKKINTKRLIIYISYMTSIAGLIYAIIANINLAKPDLSPISLSLNRTEAIADESGGNWQQVNSCQTKETWSYVTGSNPLYLSSATKTCTCITGNSFACTQGYEVYDYDAYHIPHLVIINTTTKNCTEW
jgi:hypothetical protein